MKITFAELAITFTSEDEDEEDQIESLKVEADRNGFEVVSHFGRSKGFTVEIHEDFT